MRFLRLVERAQSARLFSVSSEVAFFALLALVPALSILVSVYGLVLDRTRLWSQILPLLELLPQMAQEIIRDQTVRLTATSPGTLSLNLGLGFLLAAWSANAATKALFEAINLQYGRPEARPFVRLNLLSLATTLGAVVFAVAALAILALLPLAKPYLPYARWIEWLASWLRFPLFFAASVGLVSLLYRVGLMERQPWRALAPGALLASTLWTLISLGFGWYAAGLGHYAATFGSLAAVIVFLTWLWLSVAAILIGAAFNATRRGA